MPEHDFVLLWGEVERSKAMFAIPARLLSAEQRESLLSFGRSTRSEAA